MADITQEDVQHVALLSRVALNDDEVQLFQRQLENILTYIEKLDQLDTDGVEPMASVMGLHNVFRDDELQPSLSTEEALKNAPEQNPEFFLVPTIVE